MNNLYEKAEAARHFIRNLIGDISLSGAIITGTGLGEVWKKMEIIESIAYSTIPHFQKNTVESHQGMLHICKYSSEFVAVFSGRFHYYEGFDASQVAFPTRVMKLLGIDRLLLTNVAGGLNEKYNAGSIVAITDHINLQPGHVLRGVNDHRFGLRFPDMLHTYDMDSYRTLGAFAQKENITLHYGVYLALQGPSLETPAEYDFLHRIGADLVGMSTVPEAISGAHMDMKITALSVVSNVCYPIENITETTVEEVIAVAKKTIPVLNELILCWVES